MFQEKPHFDVSLVCPFNLDVGLYLIKKELNSPLMYVFSGQTWPRVDNAMGNPMNPATEPSIMYSFSQRMTFLERLKNAFSHAFLNAVTYYSYLPNVERKIQEILKLDHTPDINEVINRKVYI